MGCCISKNRSDPKISLLFESPFLLSASPETTTDNQAYRFIPKIPRKIYEKNMAKAKETFETSLVSLSKNIFYNDFAFHFAKKWTQIFNPSMEGESL